MSKGKVKLTKFSVSTHEMENEIGRIIGAGQGIPMPIEWRIEEIFKLVEREVERAYRLGVEAHPGGRK